MLFKDGEFVREGNVLSPIERASSDAAQQQARGALPEAQDKYANATAHRARAETGEDRHHFAPSARPETPLVSRRRARKAPCFLDCDRHGKTFHDNPACTDVCGFICADPWRNCVGSQGPYGNIIRGAA
jgi:hypothetical protein